MNFLAKRAQLDTKRNEQKKYHSNVSTKLRICSMLFVGSSLSFLYNCAIQVATSLSK